ncbi:MAG: O-antigen ligase family protein [Rhodococcus sp. (in: high G+C Gram-positive bacteria)]
MSRVGAGEVSAITSISFAVSLFAVVYPVTALVIAVLAAAAATVWFSLRDLRVAWCAFFFAICANGGAVDVFGLTVRPEYLLAPLFVAALFAHHRRVGRPFRTPDTRELVVAAAMAVWVVIALSVSAFAAPVPLLSIRSCIQFIVGLAVFFPLVLSELDRVFAVRSGTVVLAAISTGSIAYWLFDPSRRVSGLAFEYNIMGSMCAAWLAVMFYAARQRDSAGRPVIDRALWWAAVPIVIALLLTSTRAAWGALLVIAVFAAVRMVRRFPVTVIAAGALGCVALFVLVGLRDSVGDEDTVLWRIAHLTDFDSGTGAYRVMLWNDAMTQIGARDWSLLWGTGANSFSQYNPVDPTLVGAAYLSSMWLGLLYDVGVLGLVAFLVAVAGVVSRIPRKIDALPLLFALAACASLTNIIWFAFPWVFLALLVGAGSTVAPAARTAPGGRLHRRRHRADARAVV